MTDVGFGRLASRSEGVEPAGKEINDDSPKLSVDNLQRQSRWR